MTDALLDLARRFADRHANAHGVAHTPIAGLSVVRIAMTGQLQVAVNKPLVAMLLQGMKQVTTGPDTLSFGPGESMVISADVPTTSQILRASPAAPYYSLVMELDPTLLQELAVEMQASEVQAGGAVSIEVTDSDVADAALRLMRLLDNPSALPILKEQLRRELHFWLLRGRHGAAIRRLGVIDSHAHRIARAVAVIRESFDRPLRIADLADVAGMSESSFHHHFRAVTTLSPLQFQKQVRLIEARRQMLSEGASVSMAAFAVGYESVPQFTREYGRLFGAPPMRDMRNARMPPASSIAAE